MPIERVLEEPCRLSESVAWEIQRRFFETSGPDAWADGVVPYYVTTNAYIAQCYARVIAAWVEDLLALQDGATGIRIDRDQPIHVVELGAGTGRLAFLLAQELATLSKERELPRFTVVATDFAEANVARWRDHPDLRPIYAAGSLDAAVFDADEPGPLELVHSGRRLGPEALANPVIAILNYVVDSLRQDAFYVRAGRLEEITTQAVMPAGSTRDASAPDASVDLQLRLNTRPTELPVYDDVRLDALLERYVGCLQDAEVLVPIGTIRALRHLRRLAGDRLCVLAGDKGFRSTNDLEGRRLGDLVKTGAFSFMANFDAIGFDMGGISLTHDNRYSRFTVAAYSSVDGELPRFRGAYRDFINDFGPAEYNRLFKLARASWKEAPIPLVLLLLRLSNYDPGVFAVWSKRILAAAGEVGAAIREDIALCLEQVLMRTYHVSSKDDVRFLAGRVYFRLGRFAEATVQFIRVVTDSPERAVGWYNLGLCREQQGKIRQARDDYRKAREIDPDYERAQSALERVS